MGFLKKYNYINYKFISLLIIILIIKFITIGILIYFNIWLLGVLVYLFKKKIINNFKLHLILSSFCFIFAIILSKILTNYYLSDFLTALAFSYLFFLMTKFHNNKINFHFKKISIKISQFSYSLYLLHFPLVLLITKLIFNFNKIEINLKNFFYYTLISIFIIILSYLFYLIFEKNTQNLSKAIINIRFIKKI